MSDSKAKSKNSRNTARNAQSGVRRKKQVAEEELPPPPALPLDPPTPVELPDYEIDHHSHHSPAHFLRDLIGDIRARIVLALLISGLILWVAIPPAYQQLKVWRAMRFLAQSEVAANEGNIPKSIALMRRAILMAPNEERIFRKVRLYNASLGDAAALNSLQQLMLEKQATTEELLTLAEQAIKANNPVIAKAAMDQVQEDHSARKTTVQMRLLEGEGNLKDALDLAREELPNLTPDDQDRLLLATAEMTLRTDVKASRAILLQLVDKNSTTGIAALRLLAAQTLVQRGLEFLKSDKTADKLLAHPLHTPDDTLVALDLRLLENPAAKPALLAQTMTERNSAPPDDALAFARWLNRRLHYKESVDFIGRERAISHANWLLLYLDALAGLERWNDIFTLLDAETIIGLSDSIRLLFLARAAEKSGEREKADQNWREMQLGLAYEKPEVISFIAAYSLRIGAREQAIKAYTTLSQRKETALEGYLGLIRCWPKNTSAAELLPLYQELTDSFPMLAEAKNDQTYLKLLTNEKPATTAAIATEIHKANPETLATLSIHALGMLKTGKPTEADALYKEKSISWLSAPPPWAVVRAAVLYAVGKNKEADESVRGNNKSQLRPEERALLPAQ
ncbi:MAG: hypothetical protein ACKOEZ_03620 [Spartobacteria bacterium]